MKATLNWLASALLALALSSAWLLDGPSDPEAAQDSADDLTAAAAQAQRPQP